MTARPCPRPVPPAMTGHFTLLRAPTAPDLQAIAKACGMRDVGLAWWQGSSSLCLTGAPEAVLAAAAELADAGILGGGL